MTTKQKQERKQLEQEYLREQGKIEFYEAQPPATELRSTPAAELQRSKKFSLAEISSELARRFVTPKSHR
jgi:hypothetical protein